MNDESKELTPKELIIAFIFIAGFIATMISYYFYSKEIAYVVIGIAVLYGFREIKRMPSKDKERVVKIIEKQDKSIVGRIMAILQGLLLIYLVYLLIHNYIK